PYHRRAVTAREQRAIRHHDAAGSRGGRRSRIVPRRTRSAPDLPRRAAEGRAHDRGWRDRSHRRRHLSAAVDRRCGTHHWSHAMIGQEWAIVRRALAERRRSLLLLAAAFVANLLAFGLIVYPLSQRVANVEQREQAAAQALL